MTELTAFNAGLRNAFLRSITEIFQRPFLRPRNPCFSSGPCAKPPGWKFHSIKRAVLGRSHRRGPAREKLREIIRMSKDALELPEGYEIILVPGSDTGAMVIALTNLLGPRPVDVLAWETFGNKWVEEVTNVLKIPNAQTFKAPYGELPNLKQANFDHDVVFTWNGTTSGVMVPNGDWIPDERAGLTICDATSAVMAMPIPWKKCDVITYSWQKAMGGEAAHGMLVLSPRAIDRLKNYPPDGVSVLFRLKKDGKLIKDIFDGGTINTPSMMCVEDSLVGLEWMRSIGGIQGTIARTNANFRTLSEWVKQRPWLDFLAKDPATRSPTSVCLRLNGDALSGLEAAKHKEFCGRILALVERHEAGYDFNNYRAAPDGFRIWCGPTVETRDVARLTKWIDWAFENTCREYGVVLRPRAQAARSVAGVSCVPQ